MRRKIAKIVCFLMTTACFLPWPALALTPNDPNFGDQWYLQAINAPAAWDKTTGSRKVIVAVLDTGTEYAHPDLMDNIWTNPGEIPFNNIDDDGDGLVDDIHGWDFVDNQPNPGPDFDLPQTSSGLTHGTIVAGLIGAVGNNATDGTGLNWQVSIMPLKVLSGEGVGDPLTVAKAIDYAVAKGAIVINLSLIGMVHGEELYRALQRAYMADVVVVTAAGNDGEDVFAGDLDLNPQFPVCYDGPDGEPWWVIGVAALDDQGVKAPFSGYGFHCVDIAAPGVKMPGPLVFSPNHPGWEKTFGGQYSGTSLAAPLVSGAAALLKAFRPQLTVKQVYDLLVNSADNIDNLNPLFPHQLGAGRLNVGRALALAEELYPRQAYTLAAKPVSQMASQTKADINGDGVSEKVQAVWGRGAINIVSPQGLLIRSFSVYNKYKGKFAVAAGDIDADGQIEVITAQPVKNPVATVWTIQGQKKQEVSLAGDYRRGLQLNLIKK